MEFLIFAIANSIVLYVLLIIFIVRILSSIDSHEKWLTLTLVQTISELDSKMREINKELKVLKKDTREKKAKETKKVAKTESESTIKKIKSKPIRKIRTKRAKDGTIPGHNSGVADALRRLTKK